MPRLAALKVYEALARLERGDTAGAEVLLAEMSSLEEVYPGVLELPRSLLGVVRVARGGTHETGPPAGAAGVAVLGSEWQGFLHALSALKADTRADACRALARGMVLEVTGLPLQALDAADAVLSELPDEPLARSWRARLLDTLGRHADAVSAYRAIMTDQPSHVTTRVQLSRSHMAEGETAEAISVLEELRAARPAEGLGWVTMQLGDLYMETGDHSLAVERYLEATREPGQQARAANNAAWLMATELDRAEEAVALAQKAAARRPDDPQILDTLGWALYLAGDAEAAVPHLAGARAALPQSPSVRYHLAVALAATGQSERARTELQEAMAISSEFPEAAQAAELLQTLSP